MQVNPVIVKELRGRMRGPRAVIVLTIYLVVLSGVALLFYWMLRATSGYTTPQSSQVGKFLFGALVIFQMIMVSLLTPAFTAGSITSEREQRTYDLLMTTLLPARSVVLGKLGAALSYVVLLIIAIAPLESLAFMFGGVSPEEIICSQIVMVMAAVLYASVGMFWSSFLKSSVGSNVLTYGSILFLLIGVPVLYFIIMSITTAPYSYSLSYQPPSSQPGFWYISGLVLCTNPLIAMIVSEIFITTYGDPLFVYTTSRLAPGHSMLVMSPWLLFCIEALVISFVLVLGSIRWAQPVHYRQYKGRVTPPSAAQMQAEMPPMPPMMPLPPDQAQGPVLPPGLASQMAPRNMPPQGMPPQQAPPAQPTPAQPTQPSPTYPPTGPRG